MLKKDKACKFWLKNCKIRFFGPSDKLGLFFCPTLPFSQKPKKNPYSHLLAAPCIIFAPQNFNLQQIKPI